MAAPAFASAPRQRRKGTHAEIAAREVSRHRLTVLADNVADVVGQAGGWLSDRALAGWEITVYLTVLEDDTALQVLGLAGRPMSEMRSPGGNSGRPTAVAVAGDLLRADHQVRRFVIAALVHTAEVTVWGAPPPDDLDEGFRVVQHRPSAAARAFKSHAARVAEHGEMSTDRPEVFQTSTRCSRKPGRRGLSLAALDSPASTLPAAAVWAPVPAVAQ